MKGAYCLLIFLNSPKKIKCGKKQFFFNRGYYGYTGSALGNLEKRIERHKRKEKKKFWHIDYFLEHGRIVRIKKIITSKKIECRLADKINKLSNEVIAGFGSSDCKCKGHLAYFNKNPIKKLSKIKL